jgi:uncharacterized protein (DUF1778 family)
MTTGAIRERARRDTTTRERRDSVVNVRMARQTRELIDEAAEAVGKTRSEFMVESARTHAIDVLLDKRLFSLGTEHYDAFLKALDAPPAPNEKLKRLLKSKSPWER